MTGYLSRQNLQRNRNMKSNSRKDKKILFLDMDGTTLDDKKRISKENLEALRRVSYIMELPFWTVRQENFCIPKNFPWNM